VHERREQLIGLRIPDILSIEDLRRSFVSHARIVAEDAITRKFEFFMNYQMAWSEELLTETHKRLNEIRKSPLEEFRACFDVPAVASRLRHGVNPDQLIVTLAAFWVGLCKMYLGGCPCIDFGHRVEPDSGLAGGFDFTKAIGDGFDLIISAVLKEEN